MFRLRILHGLFQLEPRTLLLMAYCKIQIYIYIQLLPESGVQLGVIQVYNSSDVTYSVTYYLPLPRPQDDAKVL